MFLRQIWYPAWAFPLVLTSGLAVLMGRGYVEFDEQSFERLAINLLCCAVTVSIGRLMWHKRPYFLWLSLMCLSLMCREIHFVGTSTGLYVALAALTGVAVIKYDSLAEYLGSRVVATLLTSAFFCYFLAQTLDQQWWRFAIGKPVWSGSLEEFVEALGHVYIILVVVCSHITGARRGTVASMAKPAVPAAAVKWALAVAMIAANAILLSVPSDLAYLVVQHRDVLMGRYGVSRFMTLVVLVPISLLVLHVMGRPKQVEQTGQRQKTFKTIVLAVGIIIPIMVVDISMRLVRPKRYVGDVLMFHRPPNVAKTGLIEDIPKTAFTYPVPRRGYPDMEFTLTGDKRGFRNKIDLDQYDVLVLGDSFTEGSDVTDDEIWPAVFAAKSGASVYNLGMSGGNPRTYLETLNRYIDEISPETVVCMVYEGNDFRASNFAKKRSSRSLAYLIFKKSPLRRAFKNSLIRIFGPLNAKRPIAKGKGLAPNHPLYAVSCMPLSVPAEGDSKYYAFELKPLLRHLVTRDEFADSAGFKKTCEALREIKKRCVAEGRRLVIIYAPDKPHVLMPLVKDTLSPEKLDAFMGLKENDLPEPDKLFEMLVPRLGVQEAAVEQFCRSEGIEFVSPTEPLRRGIAANTQAYFTYDQHWTPPGHAIVAETLHDYLRSTDAAISGGEDSE